MQTQAVVMQGPGSAAVRDVTLVPPSPADLVVDVQFSGISAGTERLLWTGRMPHFPGMGYPLVPGYETVGRVAAAGAETDMPVGTEVFVPGANCFEGVRGLFGGAASRLVVPATRVARLAPGLGERGTLLALAATAHHAIAGSLPSLIVGHGTLGRLLARLTIALGAPPPTVWEIDPERRAGAAGYDVVAPETGARGDHRVIVEASGDAAGLDALVGRLGRGGEIVLAGFYAGTIGFAFAPAFMREARLRCAAEWTRADLDAVNALAERGALSLDGLITHREAATRAGHAYETAFGDPACLKMILDWRQAA